ncbi:MAG: M48 family metallopeptidase [Phycisphaerales bacterium]|nr:M48 family metallopeptidase [Planctomycetota bacterium]MCH8508571.1 M48 family metallopeptidase [Phycisphaerales bacterium]
MDAGRQTIDFFGDQDRARARSRRLVVMYVIAVLAICLTVSGVAALAVALLDDTPGGPRVGDIVLVALITAAITGLIIAGGSLYRIAELRSGGSAVARALGGRPIDPSTRDLNERRVLNVVEEMAIASGVPVPPVYIMREEKGINAFAAGYRPGDAVIGVTRGCVEGLTRDELQAVMAHEFSHILNGDMRLNVRLIGLLNGIVLISLFGHILLRVAPRGVGRSKEGAAAVMVIFLVAIVMLIVGSIGALAARIIQAAVSRQREFLADAAAVQFTRNPSGIANALRRIGGATHRARVRHPRAQEAGHMFFGEAISGASMLGSSLASHPPLAVRIKRVDPSWDGTMLTPLEPEEDHADTPKPLTPRERLARSMPGADAGPVGQAAILLPLLALAGQPGPEHVEHARSLIAAIPEPLKEAAHDISSGRAVVYALLLHAKDEPVRAAQIKHLESNGDPAIAALVRKLAPEAVALDRTLRLPLLDMTLGALAHLSDEQHRTFRANVRALIQMDKSVSLFEWVTLSVLTRHLDERFGRTSAPVTQYYALGRLGDEVSVLLSAFAHAGAQEDGDAPKAFALGAGALRGVDTRLLTVEQCSLDRLDKALTTLASCTGRLKGELLKACALVAGADHEITAQEAELLRAVGDILGVPTPPLLPGQKLL